LATIDSDVTQAGPKMLIGIFRQLQGSFGPKISDRGSRLLNTNSGNYA